MNFNPVLILTLATAHRLQQDSGKITDVVVPSTYHSSFNMTYKLLIATYKTIND